MKNILSIGAFSITLILVIINLYVFKYTGEGRINITLSDQTEELRLLARYPLSRTNEVATLLRDDLFMNADMMLHDIVINDYQTPDHLSHFFIRSHPGRLKIVLNKSTSGMNSAGYLTNFNEHLKLLLTQPIR